MVIIRTDKILSTRNNVTVFVVVVFIFFMANISFAFDEDWGNMELNELFKNRIYKDRIVLSIREAFKAIF